MNFCLPRRASTFLWLPNVLSLKMYRWRLERLRSTFSEGVNVILNLLILCAISLKALSWRCVIVLNRAFLWAESVCPNNFRKSLSSLMSLIMAFLTHSWLLLTTVYTPGDLVLETLYSSSDTSRPREGWYPRSNNLP